jgi:methylmalonyl-CoA mutase N-terminal domain/subunit
MGGVVKAIDRGYFRRAIAESSLAEQKMLDAGQTKIVGVTDFVDGTSAGIPILEITQETEISQIARLKQLKQSRDAGRHAASLERLRNDARDNTNLMPALIDAAKADATVGEMMDTMKSVFGAYNGGPEW